MRKNKKFIRQKGRKLVNKSMGLIGFCAFIYAHPLLSLLTISKSVLSTKRLTFSTLLCQKSTIKKCRSFLDVRLVALAMFSNRAIALQTLANDWPIKRLFIIWCHCERSNAAAHLSNGCTCLNIYSHYHKLYH